MKKLFALILTLALVISVGASIALAEETYTIGFSFYNLANPVWAELVETAKTYGESLGHNVTYVDCGQDSQQQIAQIENFIMSECDAIVILPIDPVAIENVVQEALDAGIRVISYSTDFVGAESNLALDPVANGYALIEMCGPWIDEHYPDGEFEWTFMNIPTIELGVQEGNAVEEAMLLRYPNSKLVGTAAVLNNEEGMAAAEAFLSAYPDCRVYLGISGGAGVGGNEAIKGNVPEAEWADYGLFSVDATEQECVIIANGEVEKGSLGLGGGTAHGTELIDICLKALSGEELERYIGLPITRVTAENVEDYVAETYGG